MDLKVLGKLRIVEEEWNVTKEGDRAPSGNAGLGSSERLATPKYLDVETL